MRFCFISLVSSLCPSLFAGNLSSSMLDNDVSFPEMNWNMVCDEDDEPYEVIAPPIIINAAKDFNDCMDMASKKNDRDHERCDKKDRGETCHEKADRQYERNRESCERVSHSDNIKSTAKSWNKEKK